MVQGLALADGSQVLMTCWQSTLLDCRCGGVSGNDGTCKMASEAGPLDSFQTDLSSLSLSLHLFLLGTLLLLCLAHRHTRAAVIHVASERV
jgi:hypothetical protein